MLAALQLGCLMPRHPVQAMKVYERLRKQGLNPNSTTYNALITAYGKACNLKAVRSVLPAASALCMWKETRHDLRNV